MKMCVEAEEIGNSLGFAPQDELVDVMFYLYLSLRKRASESGNSISYYLDGVADHLEDSGLTRADLDILKRMFILDRDIPKERVDEIARNQKDASRIFKNQEI